MKPVIGHYNVLERLGGGALGDVFRARDTHAGRTVALMAPPPELIASPARRQRFLDDARRAAMLNHPNIAMLFDVIEESDGCYLAYEFADGPSLREEMGRAAMDEGEALRLGAHIADALAEGHAKRVVHGDLRPDTIVVTPKGSVKVLNFGMTIWTSGGVARAKAAIAPEALDADEAQVAGYLSPEQARGATVDPRSDLFAFGVILYEMLTGVQPFSAATSGATIVNVVSRTPAPPSAVNPDLPAGLDRIVMKLLAKEPGARYQSATSVAADLRRVTSEVDAPIHESAEALASEQGRRGLPAWVAVAALLVLVAAVWWYLRS